jgi:hypothetical protein
MKMVEMRSCILRTVPTEFIVTVNNWAQSTERNEAMTPTAVTISGK